jgi:outer membrane autotransporter protein
MKKIAFAALVAVSLSASALEVGVTGSNLSEGNRYGAGVTVGQKMAGLGITAGVSLFNSEANNQTRLSLVADRHLIGLGPVSVSGRVGGAWLNNKTGDDGFAGTLGVGTSMSVTKNLSAGVSFDRQWGQSAVKSFNGNVITAGVKVGF